MILVFGGGGQLGQELARVAARRKRPLVAIPRFDADIADAGSVGSALKTYQPTVVVNAAAYTKVDQAEDEPDEAYRCNVDGPGNLATICASAGIPLIHISTDYVFDGSKQDAYVETDSLAPVSAYGRSKAAGEDAVRTACRRHLILRTAWVYGEFGRNFLKTVLRLARERDELQVVADQCGSPTSTRDLAAAIVAVAPRLAADDAPFGTYHYSGQGITTWHGFAERIIATRAAVAGNRPRVVPISTEAYPAKAARPANSALDSSLFARTFDIRPQPWEAECDSVTAALCAMEARHRSEPMAEIDRLRPLSVEMTDLRP